MPTSPSTYEHLCHVSSISLSALYRQAVKSGKYRLSILDSGVGESLKGGLWRTCSKEQIGSSRPPEGCSFRFSNYYLLAF